MNNVKIEPFKVIGIAVRTTNENEQAAKDIPVLWENFMKENVHENIPDKIDNTVYSIYTDYEKDHTKPYTTLLGCKVESLDNIPEGMIGKSFDGGDYVKFTTKGNLAEGLVINEWFKIWNMDLGRTFTADFEMYGEKAQNPSDAEVDILIAVN
ncbi:GyrI-like domain-containing protein [Chryseobacterium jejuense]|uniref:Bacterial transcription activator, effector binding domain n=1 Tax=Chryseobacterium jejuense TaxID=445960 RepID=A0A2X2XMZ9_CHRJE|nr:GyrI-like domain-containing protein [Chryseobacterium jejuense]SDI81309.1 Predicted transcriptional regulator YdeE, contains AraC-type DNA-binding domain [Chryseobacterium jejuense]SQB27750.1 Bacterial transcription activator, effector binding domain [Chryseobacterium jejuense]